MDSRPRGNDEQAQGITMADLKTQIQDDMKEAMRAKDSARLGTIRLLMAAVKQVEIDSMKKLDDEGVMTVLNKMIKQRRESIVQFEAAARQELADKEKAEITILQAYLPEQMSEADVDKEIKAALAETAATSIKDMGKVMAILKTKLAGRTDMGSLSEKIKKHLS